MPRIKKEEKEIINNLSQKELSKIVLKLASKDKLVYEYLYVNYLNKEDGEKDLFNKTLDNISLCFAKKYKAYAPEQKATKMLSASIKELNDFIKSSKNKNMEAELLIVILEEAFLHPEASLGTCFTGFDNKIAQILKRLITLVTKKMHEDYLIEYQDKINKYLKIIHKQSGFNDYVYELPDEI